MLPNFPNIYNLSIKDLTFSARGRRNDSVSSRNSLIAIWIECLKARVPSVQVYYRKTGVVILKSLQSIKHYR